MATIDKRQLCEMVASDMGRKPIEVEGMLNCTLNHIMIQVRAGREVRLIGFGKFFKRFRKGREMINPGLGGAMTTDDKFLPAFNFGKDFKKFVESVGSGGSSE